MNQFYSNAINYLRGARGAVSNTTAITGDYSISGIRPIVFAIYHMMYTNFKKDAAPTFFCMWGGDGNSESLVHSINFHYLNQSDLQWFMKTIRMWKMQNQVLTPMMFYRYLKSNRISVIHSAYRTYKAKYIQSCHAISPGISNLSMELLTKITDSRDYLVEQFNRSLNNPTILPSTGAPQNAAYNEAELREHVIEVLNERPLYFKNNHDGWKS